ncbi:MAG TPA: carboxylesterase family protein, partial [Acidimicrobiales bacterium]
MSVVVSTASGTVRGSDVAGVTRFLGIPYARAGRFEQPGPVEPWTGELDANAPPPQAPQMPGLIEQFMGTADLAQDERCQNLNVWTPGCDGAKRPVLVWVHGGAFIAGSAASAWYDGEAFARNKDVVVVSVNYRLGLLGFTHLSDRGGERFAGSGNLGLLDQVAALRWVREHAAAFGGDPDNVTIFGESAGGASVLALMAAPGAKGLFHRAIAQSPGFTQLRTRERADEAAGQVLGELGLAPTELDRLLELPVQTLLDAQQSMFRYGMDALTAFAPTP